MRSYIFSCQSILLVLFLTYYQILNEVEASQHSVGDWFGSGFKDILRSEYRLQKLEQNEELEPSPKPFRKKLKKKHKTTKTDLEEDMKKPTRRFKKRSKKKPTKRIFVKSDTNYTSNESFRKRQPVDIIVHIKMND